MAVLGYEGIVELSREWPAPTALADERLQRGANPSLDLTDQAFQSGDEVLLVSLRGVPLGIGLNGAAPCPDGHAFWTDTGTAIGPALAGRTAGGGFWSADSSAPFWESAATVGFQQTATAFIHRDEMDDVRFYDSEINAINGGTQGLIPLRNVSPGVMLILPAISDSDSQTLVTLSGQTLVTLAGAEFRTLGTDSNYSTAALDLLEAVAGMEIPDGEQPASNLTTVPQILIDTAADVAQRGWLIQCDLTSWVFEMDATQLDETAIGQVFGESAKGTLRGAGSLSGVIDYDYVTGENNSLGLLKLVMLTAQGSKAKAKFQISEDYDPRSYPAKEKLFYETDILLSRSSVNTQFDDAIRFTTDFVATGRIRLAKER